MKRIGNLYQKIISIENLYIAEKKARKGKSKRKNIINFIKNLDDNIQKLHNELINKTYSTSEYYHFIIYEPKKRNISRLEYVDRIVHHAILIYLEPIFIKCFISQTYSCIKNRGIHGALKQLNKYLKNEKETKYCLKIDIHKFYPSINNEILKNKLRRKFKDKDLLYLLDNIIDSIEGIPLGNYTSQFFGNFYINDFLHWLKQDKKVKLIVYCDDIIILHNDKEFLHNLRIKIQEYLHNNLKLKLSKYQVFLVENRGIDFVGYKSYHTHILLRKSIKNKFKKMLKNNYNKKSIASYNGWLRYGNCKNLKNKLLKI